MGEALEGWVLFGGGAYIYLMLGYLLGPLKGLMPKRFYGSSAGALLSALVAYKGIDETVKILKGITNTNQIFNTKDFIGLLGDLAARRGAGIATYKPLYALIQQHITGVPSVPVTICRNNFDTEVRQFVTAMPDGTFIFEGDDSPKTLADFQDALCCSCINAGAIDLFPDKNGQLWGDGGYSDIGPTDKALADGCTDIKVLLTGLYNPAADSTPDGDLIDTIIRGYDILVKYEMKDDVLAAINAPNITTTVFQAQPQGLSSKFIVADEEANIALGQATIGVDGKSLITTV